MEIKRGKSTGKQLIVLVFILVLIGAGCSDGSSAQPVSAPAEKASAEIPSDAQIIADLSSQPSDITDQNEDILELKHWKYGVRPPSTSADVSDPSVTGADPAADGKVVSFQFLTAEEMDQIVAALIKGGFLADKPSSEQEFRNALSKYQNQKGLAGNGELDAVTIKFLLDPADQ